MDVENYDKYLPAFITLSETLGILTSLLITFWIHAYLGGFGWKNDSKKFSNWHVVVMPASVILMGNGIIMFRVLRKFSISSVKWLHFLIQTAVLLFVTFGTYLDYEIRKNLAPGTSHGGYSLRAWFCYMVATLVGFQYLLGVCFFLFKCFGTHKRETYAVMHAFFGLFTLITAGVTAILGLSEKAESTIEEYDILPAPALIVNMAGVSLMCYVGSIIYIAINPYFESERPVTPSSSGHT